MKVLLAGRNTLDNYIKVIKYFDYDYDTLLNYDSSKDYDCLIIPGGVDVNPCRYNEKASEKLGIVDDELDETQLEIIDRFVKEKKPILGICRGLQLLNVYFKGTLIQDIESKITHTQINRKDSYHSALNEDILKELFGLKCIVNSSHHQAIKDLGKGLIVTSRSEEDGIIEGIRHTELPIIAVQWHPERMSFNSKEGYADGLLLFKEIFKKAII